MRAKGCGALAALLAIVAAIAWMLLPEEQDGICALCDGDHATEEHGLKEGW